MEVMGMCMLMAGEKFNDHSVVLGWMYTLYWGRFFDKC